MGNKSLAATLRYALDKELEEYRANLSSVLTSLKHARDAGETDAESVDRHLYGKAN